MTTDRLAALLHQHACDMGVDWDLCRHIHDADAARLVAAGVTVAQPAPDALRVAARDPRPDWDALARLVDAAIRREEITASRGAEIMGVRLQTWRDWVRDLPALEADR